MGRVNKWKQFGDAFDAVYTAGNTLGKSIQTGKIAFKSYEDEEGNELKGLALDRAKMDDYAAAEQRYGDPMEALRMRTGVESLGQNRLKTDYDTDTYDERVFQGGIGASNKLRADTSYTNSAAGLNVANTGLVDEKTRGARLNNDFNRDTLASRTALGNATNRSGTAQADGQTLAYQDPSYLRGLISSQQADQAKNDANTIRFGSPEYAASLKATDNKTTAEASLARNTADLQNSVITDPKYKDNYVGAELATMARTRTMAEVDLAIAENPQTLELAEKNLSNLLTTAETAANNLQTDFNLSSNADYQSARFNEGLATANLNRDTAMAAAKNAETGLNLANNPDFQAARYASGLSTAELGQVEGEEAVLLAKQSLAVNTFISEWGKTGNPDDPTSMRNLVKGISQLNPIMGQKLSQEYGEHELWEITNRGLRMRAEVNEALSTRGAAGAQEILDKYNGDKFGIKTVTNDDGSMSMVETRAAGPGGQETEIVRTIASGADEKTFMQDLNAAMDPASLMEYSMNLVDMDYKRALTMFSEAQAKAAGVGKPMGATDMAYRTMVNPEASPADRQLAMAFLMRESPELYAQLANQMNFKAVLTDAGKDNGKGDVVPDLLVSPVDPSAPITAQEETTASTLMEQLLTASAEQREEILSGNNKALLSKVAPEFLEMENNKTTAVDYMLKDLQKGNLNLTPEGIAEFSQRYLTASQKKNPMDKGGGVKKIMTQIATAMKGDPMGVLNILIGKLNDQIISKPLRENGAQQSSRVKKNNRAKQQIVELEQLIAAMQGR